MPASTPSTSYCPPTQSPLVDVNSEHMAGVNVPRVASMASSLRTTSPKFCSECGAAFARPAKFCSECGAKIMQPNGSEALLPRVERASLPRLLDRKDVPTKLGHDDVEAW